MQVKNDDDLHGCQRSTEVKHSKPCYMAIKLGQINRWCKFRMMATFMELKGQQRSNIVNNDLRLPNLVSRFADTSLGWLWPSQRSKVMIINNSLSLPNLVRRAADASFGWFEYKSWEKKKQLLAVASNCRLFLKMAKNPIDLTHKSLTVGSTP